MSVNKELVKGSTSMLVLGVLEEKEMYGYQIIKELEQPLLQDYKKGEKRVGQTERGMEGICRSSRKGAAAAKCVICEKVAQRFDEYF